MPRPGIPPLEGLPPEVRRVLQPMKETMDRVTGKAHAVDALQMLSTNASTNDIIATVNALIKRLQED